MAHFWQQHYSAHEFIKEAFAPMIAVMHTPGVDEVCKKNHLNFIQLLKPFSKTTVESSMKDTSSGVHIPVLRDLKISFCDINARPPPPTVARSYFNFSISSNITYNTTKIAVGEETIDVPVSTPWFDAWRDTFLQVQYPSEHEFTKHFISCLIVVSSLDPSPLEKLEELMEILHGNLTPAPSKLPKWFGTSMILTTFLYLHDSSIGSLDLSVFEAMKVTYGINKCFLLSINSRVPGEGVPQISDPWARHISSFIDYKEDDSLNQEQTQGIEAAEEAGEKSSPTTPVIVHPLSPVSDGSSAILPEYEFDSENKFPEHDKLISYEDIDRIKQFVNDFCVKALIPHFEQHIHQLSDQISNKKGVSRSLFSATKRWFGSKPGTPGNHISPTAIAYSSDSHELQLRKLGDLCFMIGQYSLAFTAYHSAKRDFEADGAWLHYAGALEMGALSAFMSNSESLSKKVVDYAEESILTYQNSCRMNQFATRATLLSVECLKSRGLFGEAAKQLIRMSGEDSDLRSAVLLEQAAYCFLSNKPVMFRKYAFHMVLAGHRFSKASHRNHSMRCYHQAYQVYGNKSWSAAEDHILYTIGKQASHLKLHSNAFEALSLLVTRSSRQSPQQQEMYFKDYLLSIEQLYQKSDDEVKLSLPVIDCNLIQVALNMPKQTITPNRIPACYFYCNTLSPIRNLSEEAMWNKLEEKLVNYGNNMFAAFIFKPTADILSNMTDNCSPAIGYIGESIGVCICLKNPLNVLVNLKDITLLWTFNSDISGEGSSQNSDAATTNTAAEIILPPDSTRYITLTITPNQVGELSVTGVSYFLYDPISCIKVFGKQRFEILRKNKPDRRLQIDIKEPVPGLEVTFSGLKKEFISGEIFPFNIHIKNTGSITISKIVLSTSENFRIFMKGHEAQFPDQIFNLDLADPLDVNDSIDIALCLQPVFQGNKNLDILVYYESSLKRIKPSYRLIKHSWPSVAYSNIKIQPSKACEKDIVGLEYTKDERVVKFRLNSKLHNSVNLHNLQVESVTLISNSWDISGLNGTHDMKIGKGKDVFVIIKIIPSVKQIGVKNARFRIEKGENLPEWSNFMLQEGFTKKKENHIQFSFNWSIGMVSLEEEMRKAYGQNYVWVLCEDKFEIPILSSEIKAPMTYSISSPKVLDPTTPDDNIAIRVKIYEDPDACTVPSLTGSKPIPIIVEILNDLKQKIEVSVSFLSLPQLSTRELIEDNSADTFTWLGRTEYNKIIDINENIILTATAMIPGPGAYDVSSRVNIKAFDRRQYPIKTKKADCVIVLH